MCGISEHGKQIGKSVNHTPDIISTQCCECACEQIPEDCIYRSREKVTGHWRNLHHILLRR